MKKGSIHREGMNRRAFVQGAAATGVLGIVASAGLTACAPQQQSADNESASKQSTGVDNWVDAVSSASIATNKYTTFSEASLQDAITSFKAECVVSTANEDGTPNVAIFVPAGMFEEKYIAFTWAENQTKENFNRSKLGMIAFDVPNPTAETKELRHQGAVVKAALVEDKSLIERLTGQNAQLTGSTFVEIVDLLPVG